MRNGAVDDGGSWNTLTKVTRTTQGEPVIVQKEYCLFGCWLLAAIGLAACGREPGVPATADADPVELNIPSVPARTPIETARLNSNLFDSICHIGNPFAVVGWDLDSQTRFLYFVGPFNGSDEGLTHPYLYLAIPAPDRSRVSTTLYLDRLDESELRKHAKLGELRRFQLPHIAGFAEDEKEIERQLGAPTQTRELNSGLKRVIFERELCLNDKLLAGVYVDVDDGRLVAAKGVDHPERLKWIVSGGRPPQPDKHPTYYLDWKPREGSAQAAALDFVTRLEERDMAGAREQFGHADLPAQALEEFAAIFADSATIDSSTLTYQTTRYELDLATIAIAFRLSSGRSIHAAMELRDAGNGRWRVSDLRADGKS